MIGTDLKLLTSLDTIRASITTLQSQDDGEPEWFAANGQRRGEVFFLRPGENFEKFGPRAYFQEIDRLEIGFKLEGHDTGSVKRADPARGPDKDETSEDIFYAFPKSFPSVFQKISSISGESPRTPSPSFLAIRSP